MAKDDELLARIYLDPDDETTRQVYGDVLLERGDPRGEFIALQFKHRDALTCDPANPDNRIGDADVQRMVELLSAHEDEWLGDDLAPIFKRSTRRYYRGFLEWARLANVEGTSIDPRDERLATIRVLANAGDPAVYQRMVLSSAMRGLQCIEIVSQEMLDELCAQEREERESKEPCWGLTHLLVKARLLMTRDFMMRMQERRFPMLNRLSVVATNGDQIEQSLQALSDPAFDWPRTLHTITVEITDHGQYRSKQIANWLSGTPQLASVILALNDHVGTDVISAYLANRIVPKERLGAWRNGERYVSTPVDGPVDGNKRDVKIMILGERAPFLGGLLANLKGIARLEISPENPDGCIRISEIEPHNLKADIEKALNDAAPNIALPEGWTKSRLPPSLSSALFGVMPIADLGNYFSPQAEVIAWEKIRGWYVDEQPASFDAPPFVDHLIVTKHQAFFCIDVGGRLSRRFTFTLRMITSVTIDVDLPEDVASQLPPNYGRITLQTPSGTTLLIGSTTLATTLQNTVRDRRS